MKKVWTWQLWDWRSIRKSVFVIFGLVFAIYFLFQFPDFIRKSRSGKMTAVTNGQYVSSTDIQERSQGITGSQTRVTAVSVEYSYFVNNIQYYGKDKIPIGPSTTAFFEKLNNYKDLILSIKYNPRDPNESQIDTNY
jgi:hypothetical protein